LRIEAHAVAPLIAEIANSPSPKGRNPAMLTKSRQAAAIPWHRASGRYVRAIFGKPDARMRNIITKMLILVVPWRTAGDG